MSTNGKGSRRRKENYRAVQENWEEIKWIEAERKLLKRTEKALCRAILGPLSKCCDSIVSVEGIAEKFYVCGNCDRPCDVK